jgi:hypothetical protein
MKLGRQAMNEVFQGVGNGHEEAVVRKGERKYILKSLPHPSSKRSSLQFDLLGTRSSVVDGRWPSARWAFRESLEEHSESEGIMHLRKADGIRIPFRCWRRSRLHKCGGRKLNTPNLPGGG